MRSQHGMSAFRGATAVGSRSLRIGVLVLVLGAHSACVSAPPNEARELLDARTGTTLTSLAAPLELVATVPRGPRADPFAYLAPFETNRMGQRTMYLWIAVPDEMKVGVQPEVLIDGARLPLQQSFAEPAAVGLDRWPYASPAPWSAVLVYALDAANLARLTDAQRLEIAVPGGVEPQRFVGDVQPPNVLREFRSRLGL
jgi:hypothetical protein